MWPSLSLTLEAGVRRRRVRRAPLNVPLIVLLVGALYFVFALLLGLGIIRLTGLEPTFTVQDWMQYGAVLMAVLLLVLLAWWRLRPSEAAEARQEAAPAPAYEAPEASGSWVPDEIVLTSDEWHGRRVLEYSRPPKSEAPAAVYAKVVVPVDEQFVLRVEDRIAEARP
jgi:hypothetical protein